MTTREGQYVALRLFAHFRGVLQTDGYAVYDYYEGKAINYAIAHYDRLCRYVIDGRYRIDTNLVENGQRIVALTRKNYASAVEICQMFEGRLRRT